MIYLQYDISAVDISANNTERNDTMPNSKYPPLTEAVYYILLSLYTPLHGYGIMQNVQKMTNGRLTIGAGTLYGALSTLTKKGFIIEYKNSDPSKKEYIITPLGKDAVNNEVKRLQELFNNGKHILEGQNER